MSAVAHAKRRVEMVAWTNRFKEEPTHFISIPLNCPSIREKFRLFKEQVLATCGEVGVVYGHTCDPLLESQEVCILQ